MKASFVVKPNRIHMKVLFLNSVNNSVSERQLLYEQAWGLMGDEFEYYTRRDAVPQQQFVAMIPG